MNWSEKANSLVKDSRHDHQYKEGFVELLRVFHDMAKRLDDSLKCANNLERLGVPPIPSGHLFGFLTPPEDPKEELPGNLRGPLNEALIYDFGFEPSQDCDRTLKFFSALLSHIKSEQDRRIDDLTTAWTKQLIGWAEKVQDDMKSELDKRDEVLHDVRHYVAKEIGELRKELDKEKEKRERETEAIRKEMNKRDGIIWTQLNKMTDHNPMNEAKKVAIGE